MPNDLAEVELLILEQYGKLLGVLGYPAPPARIASLYEILNSPKVQERVSVPRAFPGCSPSIWLARVDALTRIGTAPGLQNRDPGLASNVQSLAIAASELHEKGLRDRYDRLVRPAGEPEEDEPPIRKGRTDSKDPWETEPPIRGGRVDDEDPWGNAPPKPPDNFTASPRWLGLGYSISCLQLLTFAPLLGGVKAAMVIHGILGVANIAWITMDRVALGREVPLWPIVLSWLCYNLGFVYLLIYLRRFRPRKDAEAPVHALFGRLCWGFAGGAVLILLIICIPMIQAKPPEPTPSIGR